MFDPLKRSAEVERIVMKGPARRYYRFRHARFYGGICTADAVGCNLLCRYCWNFGANEHPEGRGELYDPEQVSRKLLTVARKKDCWRFRISGSEPFLGQASADHLLEVIRLVQRDNTEASFIIETNGIYIGTHPHILDELPEADILLRIALKSQSEEQSRRITGAIGAFDLQMRAITEASRRRHIHCTVAAMPDFVDLSKVHLPSNVGREVESLVLYPGTEARLRAAGLI
ncbi:MAG: radical SAM protein [Methanotrichaceae archaeon]|nr:radical SAM protein [Methanotrichaceae archaeon]